MSDLQKSSFNQNLDKYQVLVNDTDVNSKYFKITELPDVFTGGKNAFLIAGSEYLVPDTLIKIEIKDAAGNIIYNEPGEGMISSSVNSESFITQYYEGTSKIVAIYVYPDTSFGPCTITILGELGSYDNNGLNTPIPFDWQGTYNVKWQRQINVNPSLPNTTKIRFYKRPLPNITETIQPIYQIISGSKVNTGVNQSFANVKLSQLETFAGDVKRVKVFRTSQGDISDYDLIQDILVESKELLTTYDLTSSVVGQTGIFNQEVLNNFWNTGSLVAQLTSSRIENGLKLSGSGLFTYTQSLDLISKNTYELNLDAFYSSSTASNLVIYLASGSVSSSIATLSGITPTKNLKDSIYTFKLDSDYISSSLYFSQSNSEWHLGNISLKLSQDTAFSPDEISFVTSMPTVVGNETYNFKFEFYDVNNNYVPVFVTQSAVFTGGTNFNNIILAISSSASGSLSGSINYINQISQSISGTAALYLTSSLATSSVYLTASLQTSSLYLTQSIATASYSSSIVSASVHTLSGSVKDSLTIVSGGITLLSGSFLQFTQSYYSASASFDTRFVSQSSYASSQSLYQVYSASAYLDTFIFTDANGKVNQPPTASAPGLYLGSTYMGYYSGSGTSGWKTYMDDQGDFYLTSSIANSGFLAWNASSATLQIQGAINIQGGNAATTSSVATSATNAVTSGSNAAANAVISGSNAATNVSNSLAPNIFTNSTGLINKPPNVLVGSASGLYLGSSYLGYYNGSGWKTYMADNGNFYLSGAGSDSLSWVGGVLTINGAINITGGNVQTSLSSINTKTGSLQSQLTTAGTVTSSLQDQLTTTGVVTSSLQSQLTTTGVVTSSLQSQLATAGTVTGSLQSQLSAVGSASGSWVNPSTYKFGGGGFTLSSITPSGAGLYLGSNYLGYYNGGSWKSYMNNSGQFYLAGSSNNGLSWDGADLSIDGTITARGGYIGDTTNGFLISNTYLRNGTKTSYNGAGTGVYVGTDGIGLGTAFTVSAAGALTATSATITGTITANTLTANTAGTIANWNIDSNRFWKTVSGIGTVEIKSSDNTISMKDTSDNLRLQLNPSTTLPSFASPSTTTTIDALAGVDAPYGTGTQKYRSEGTGTNWSDSQSSTAISIVLTGALNEIYINDLAGRWYDQTLAPENNMDYFFYRGVNNLALGLQYTMTAVVSGPSGTFQVVLGFAKGDWNLSGASWSNASVYTNPAVFSNLVAGTYSLYIKHEFSALKILTTTTRWYPWSYSFDGVRPDGSTSSIITVNYGTSTAYSVINAGGVIIYNGSRNIFKLSQPATTSDSFFQVTGKSQFNTSLYVSGALAADSKQFQITHPLDEDKWLYHSAVESPGAYLIYKGVCELQNGIASSSIDLISKMTPGTFESLVRRTQLFVQNNSSWDLVRGKIEGDLILIESNNNNSTASVDWMVVGERKDIQLLNSVLYDNEGNYKPEKYKSSRFLRYSDLEIISSSI